MVVGHLDHVFPRNGWTKWSMRLDQVTHEVSSNLYHNWLRRSLAFTSFKCLRIFLPKPTSYGSNIYTPSGFQRDMSSKAARHQPYTKSPLLLELSSDTSLVPNLDKFALFLLLQDQTSSEADITSADIKQLELILPSCTGEPHRLETKAMDTEDCLTGILQLCPEFSDKRAFLGKEKFWNLQAKREDCERFDHCSHFRAKRDTLAVIYFFPLNDPERKVGG